MKFYSKLHMLVEWWEPLSFLGSRPLWTFSPALHLPETLNFCKNYLIVLFISLHIIVRPTSCLLEESCNSDWVPLCFVVFFH